MLIGSRQRIATRLEDDLELSVGENPLKKVSTTKCLGVNIDENLTWAAHIESVKKKVSGNLGCLRLIQPFLNQDQLTNLYKSIIEPYFMYCSIVWDDIDLSLSVKLQKLQNRAARLITGDSYSVRSQDILKKLNWTPLNEKRTQDKAIMMHKIINGKTPSYLKELFTNSNVSNHYSLRDKTKLDLQIPRARTDYYKKSFVFSGAKLWNSLPNSLKEEKSLSKFKSKLKDIDLCID